MISCRLDKTKPGWHAVHLIHIVDLHDRQMLEILNDLFFLDPVALQRHDTQWIFPHSPHVVPVVGNCNFLSSALLSK